jgi:hypothetical protein
VSSTSSNKQAWVTSATALRLCVEEKDAKATVVCLPYAQGKASRMSTSPRVQVVR